MKDQMKNVPDSQHVAKLNQLVGAIAEAAIRNGKSKTWTLIATFKVKNVLRQLLNRAPKNEEVDRVMKALKDVKPKAVVTVARPVKTRKAKDAAVVSVTTKPAKAAVAKPAAKPVVARKRAAAAVTEAAAAPAAATEAVPA